MSIVSRLLTRKTAGDKSNHMATVHTAQMLYLWPYILFFSHALVLPAAATMLLNVSSTPTLAMLKQLEVLAMFTVAALTSIHLNTIVHPFTLADNRHYVFYVFRILLRKPTYKYLAAPMYVVSAWVDIQALGFPTMRLKSSSALKARREEKKQPPTTRGCRTSFVLAWVATTALSLVSAPLVEPRYCILPWIFWRLHVPQYSTADLLQEKVDTKTLDQGWQAKVWNLVREEDLRLWLETAFFIIVNLVTGYVFLTKGFEWRQEPGKTQRFMW